MVFATGRLVLAGAIDDVVREHKRLTAAARDTTVLGRDHVIVDLERTARQVTAVVRMSGPLLEPGWDVADMSLEDIVLTYGTPQEEPNPIPSNYSKKISETCAPDC